MAITLKTREDVLNDFYTYVMDTGTGMIRMDDINNYMISKTPAEKPKRNVIPKLQLKFGDIKGGDFSTSPEALILFEKIYEFEGEEYKTKACELIDAFNGKIYEWWHAKVVSKKKAKEYIMNYNKAE